MDDNLKNPTDSSIMDFDPTQVRNDGHPYLKCSILGAQINEHVEEAHDHALKWAVDIGFVRADSKKYKKFGAARFTWLAARAYPTVGLEELKLITDWVAFLFFYDDFCDTDEAIEDGKIQTLVTAEKRLIAIVAEYGKHDKNNAEEDGPIHHALTSICDRIHGMGASIWLERLGAHLDEFIQGCRWERVLRIEGKVPTLSTYSKLRLIISAVYPCFDFAGMFIDPTSTDFCNRAKNPLIFKLEDMANNHLSWVNDIYGVDKEIKEGTTSNIVVVLAHENGLSWPEALDRAILMCNKEEEAFMDLEACIYHDHVGGVSDNTKAYIHALKTWMRGNFDWYSETARYSQQKARRNSSDSFSGNVSGTNQSSLSRPSFSSSMFRQSWRLLGDQLDFEEDE